MTINQALICGFVGQEPELKPNSQTGSDMCFFSVATTHATKNEAGEWEKQTEWHSIVCFGRLATLAGQHLHKGSRVTVLGRLRTRKWTGKQDGIDRYKTEIIANNLEFMSSSGDSESAQPQPESRPQRGYDQTTPVAYDDGDVPF